MKVQDVMTSPATKKGAILDGAVRAVGPASELHRQPQVRPFQLSVEEEAQSRLGEREHSGGGKANQYFLRAFNLDHGTDFATYVAGKLGVTFPVLLDTDKAVSKLYDLSTMPSTVIIDRDGKVRYVHRGYLAGYEDNYEKQIRELLR